MKNISLLIVGLFIAAFSMTAQNNQGKADDGSRIAITPQISDQEIPQASKQMLINKMKQICTKNGMSGDGENPFFVMDASVDVLTKEITPTAPPMHALTLTVNLEIKDKVSGNVYSQTSIDVKGVGKNEAKAYTEAIKRLNTNSGQFKSFVETGKGKILEFYNSECDFIISKAKALNAQGESNKAIKVLESVPSVSKECYDMCMELLAEIQPEAEPVPVVASATSGESSTASVSTPSPAVQPTSTSAPAATTTQQAAVSAVVASPAMVIVGGKVLVEVNKGDFQWKKYVHGKVKTLASTQTKNEYEIIPLDGDDILWTSDIVTKWHDAKKEELKDGMLVLYSTYDDKEYFYPGYIISVENLYKNEVSIKGRGNRIDEIPLSRIIISDSGLAGQ